MAGIDKATILANNVEHRLRRINIIVQTNRLHKIRQDRMQAWIFQLADKLDVKLKYE